MLQQQKIGTRETGGVGVSHLHGGESGSLVCGRLTNTNVITGLKY